MRIFKTVLRESAGALGDLGVFLPIALGLIMINRVNATALFVAAGLLYFFSGAYFRIPMPVQPLKATSALAMALGVSAATVAGTAFVMSAFLFVLVFLKLDKVLARLFTRPVIRGIQLGLAIILLKSGFKLIFYPQGAALITAQGGPLDWYQAFFVLFLPQVPLTLANSVYATCDTSRIYFKEKAKMVTPKAVLISLGTGNLISGLAGGIPMCHGSSGVTAHFRFGARSWFSTAGLGLVFIFLGIGYMFGLDKITGLVPFWSLGLALFYIGIRHGLLILDIIHSPDELFVAIFIGLYSLIFGNLAAAFLIGMAINMVILSKRPEVNLEKAGYC